MFLANTLEKPSILKLTCLMPGANVTFAAVQQGAHFQHYTVLIT